MRKLTHEEFLNKFYEKNKHANDIEVLGHYKNSKTKLKCKCRIDGHEWESTPNKLLSGYGCPKCGYKRNTQKRTITHEEFINRLQQVNSNIEILEPYVNSQTKIKCRCKIDGCEWEGRPADLLRGHGCPECGNKRKAQKKTITHEEFIQRLHQINANIEVLKHYTSAHTKIKCRCKKCGYEWTSQPMNLLKGHGCPKCVGLAKPTHEEFMKKFYKKNKHAQDIEILGTYVNANTRIKCKCKIDGYEWSPKPNHLLTGYGCPKCAGKMKPTHEEFIQRLQQINPDIEVLGTYINIKTKIKCRCKIDGYEWYTKPGVLLRGSGCPKCKISRGEKRIVQYLDNLRLNYFYDEPYFKDLVGTGGGLLRPDIIIPSLKIWIEYDGIQHFEPVNFRGGMSDKQVQEQFKLVQQNDQIKNQYAKDNNWILIRIPFTEYDNIEQILAGYLN